MKTTQLREQTDEELAQSLEDTQKELFELRVKKKTGDATEQPLRLRTLRRDVARIRTVLAERARGKQSAQS